MKLKTLIVLAAFAVVGAGGALAQDQSPPPGGPGMGGMGGMGGGPSPEMRAAREAMMQACAEDTKTLCPGKERRELMMCLRENTDKESQPCRDAVAKMPSRRPPPPPAN